MEKEIDEVEPKNALQKILDIPVIGDVIALIIGLAPPFFLTMVIFPNSAGGDASQRIIPNLLMSSLIFIWNAALFFIFRLNITTPLIPIPLFVIGLIGVIFQIYRYFTI